MVKQTMEQDPLQAVSKDRDLRQIVEQIVMIKHKTH